MSRPRGGAARRALVTVSGVVPDDLDAGVAEGRRPRPDYVELARAFDADVIDHPEARRRTGRLGRLLERALGANAVLAWACFRARHDHELILTDGEQVGLPLAALLRLGGRRRARHAMIVHVLSVPKKVLPYRLLGLGRGIDAMAVYATAQRRFATEALGFPAERVVLTPFAVDTRFFRPVPLAPGAPPMICAVGLELRDYPTLIEAVRGLDVELVIAAASPWSKRADTASGEVLPPNVTVRRFDFAALRQLYAEARFVVIPLQPVAFQAGITSILEAMAMGRAVVCSRTEGQTDAVVEGGNGRYVPPGDPAALRRVIAELLDDPAAADRLGAAGRRWVEQDAEVATYATRLAAGIAGALDGRPPRAPATT